MELSRTMKHSLSGAYRDAFKHQKSLCMWVFSLVARTFMSNFVVSRFDPALSPVPASCYCRFWEAVVMASNFVPVTHVQIWIKFVAPGLGPAGIITGTRVVTQKMWGVLSPK